MIQLLQKRVLCKNSLSQENVNKGIQKKKKILLEFGGIKNFFFPPKFYYLILNTFRWNIIEFKYLSFEKNYLVII